MTIERVIRRRGVWSAPLWTRIPWWTGHKFVAAFRLFANFYLVTDTEMATRSIH